MHAPYINKFNNIRFILCNDKIAKRKLFRIIGEFAFFFLFFAISFLQTKIGIKAIESLEAQTVGEGRAGNFAARALSRYSARGRVIF